MSFVNNIRLKVYPELRRFESKADGLQALRQAGRAVYPNPRSWLIFFGTAIPLALCVVMVPPLLDFSQLYRIIIRVILQVALGLAIGFATPFVFRQAVRRSLWRRLAAAGIPCCLNCGYDLTGNESGVCQECGTEIERP